jgi:RHS repeat-associated protein
MKSSLGLTVDFEDDLDGNTTSVAIGTNGEPLSTIQFVRDALGLEVERHLPGGVVAHTDRDEVGRPLRQWSTRQGEVLTDRRYEWTDDERITRIVDKHFGVSEYQHDKRRRLVAASFNGEKQWRMQDAVGNVYKSPDCTDRRYGPGGRLIELHGRRVHHDKDGNVSRKPLPDGGEMCFSFYSNGLLKETTLSQGRKVSCTYDALGRRLSRASSDGQRTSFLWDEENCLYQVETAEGPHFRVPGPDGGGFVPLAEGQRHDVTFIVGDQIGSPSVLLRGDGRVQGQQSLDLFGTAREGDPTLATWPGQLPDQQASLRWSRFRCFDVDISAFLTPDPLGLRGGTSVYSYVADPLLWIDPLGLSSCRPEESGEARPTTTALAKRWPDNRGVLGIPWRDVLIPGTRIDRYGREGGTFVSPEGTPFPMRALPPESLDAPYTVYEVLKPIPVDSGYIAPWFGQPGGGIQHELPRSVADLIQDGFLGRIGR